MKTTIRNFGVILGNGKENGHYYDFGVLLGVYSSSSGFNGAGAA